MSVARLQENIRKKKTPVALGLSPEEGRLDGRYLKNFTDMYGECPMAHAEALRYHGSQTISAAAERLPAVMLQAEPYLQWGFMGMDVLCNLVNMAKSQGMYVIVDARCARPRVWTEGGVCADAATVLPYDGTECCNAGEDKLAVAAVRTAEAGAAAVQNLMAGDRPLYLAAADQMARAGAALLLETGYSLDVREMRSKLPGAFLVLTHCDEENALPAFDELGRGALVVEDAIQYAENPGEAAECAVKDMKKLVQIL